MTKPLGLVHLPAVNGLPGVEARHMELLRGRVPAVEWVRCDDRDGFLARLPEAELVLVWAFHAAWRGLATKLRIISTPAAGRDWIHAEAGPELQIWHGAFHGELMAETVLGMMLAFTRGIKDGLDRRAEAWPRAQVGGGMRALRGSRAVVVGFGNIGKWIGGLLSPLGVRITGVNRANMERPAFFGPEDRVVPLERIDGELPGADHLILALPGDTDTDSLIDARRLGLLGPDAYVYNVGRGNAVDMDALADALEGGRLAGAGLDVYPREPLPEDARIRRCPNTILLPHVSAFAPTYLDLYLREALPAFEGAYAGRR